MTTSSISELLQKEMECEGLLECVHGLKDLDKECFMSLVEAGKPLTIDEIAERIDRERSTAYRSVQRLLQSGFVQKEQVNYEQGGYYHVYKPSDPDAIADKMESMLQDWQNQMDEMIQEFREKYEARSDAKAN